MTPHPEYPTYVALAQAHVEGREYRVVARRVARASAAIIAPHGGGIEYRTSEIATAIAGQDHSLYLFEGLLQDGNSALHITSHNFDEPRCLTLIGVHDVVLSVHGCANQDGVADAVYVGGLDEVRKSRVAEALRQAWFDARTNGHKFPGTEPHNICNRGSTGRGVQLELSRGLREYLDIERFARAVRTALLP